MPVPKPCLHPPRGHLLSFYENGCWDPDARGIGDGATHSARTPEGLLVSDASSAGGSLRYYSLDWHADPARGAGLPPRATSQACV